jgi:hypothetical protein
MSITALTTGQKVLMGHALLFVGIGIYFFSKYLLSALKDREVWYYDKYGRSTMYFRDRNQVGYWMLMTIYFSIDIFAVSCWLVGLYRIFL